ncbi:MAG: tetratricopeptide repeat protein [Planctomycetota bacterium]
MDEARAPEEALPDAIPVEDDPVQAEIERRFREGRCMRCNAEGAMPRKFMRVMSFFVFTQHSRTEEFLCAPCAASTGIKEHTISALLGWWGIPWGLMTFGALFINGATLLRTTMLGRVAALSIPGALLLAFFSFASAIDDPEADTGADFSERVSDRAAAAYDRGVKSMMEGDLDKARRDLEKAQREAPQSFIIREALASCLFRAGAFDESMRHVEVLLHQRPERSSARLLKAEIFQARGDWEEALDSWRLAAEGEDESTWYPHLMRQLCARRIGRLGELRDEYRARANAHPDSVEDRHLHARLIVDPAERVAALRDVDLGAERMHRHHVDLIEALLAARKADEASALLRELEPDSLDDDFFLLEARVDFVAGRLDASLELLDEATARQESNLLMRVQRARYLQHAGRFEAADAAYDELIERVPEVGWLVFEAALAHADRGEIEEARATLASFGEADPDPDTQVWLRMTQAQITWIEKGAAAALPIIEIEREVEGSRIAVRAHAALHRAMILLDLGRIEDARRVLASVRDSGADALARRASRLALLLEDSLTPEDFIRGGRVDDVDLDNDAWFTLGLVHAAAGRTAEATRAFEQAVSTSIGPDFPRILAQRRL